MHDGRPGLWECLKSYMLRIHFHMCIAQKLNPLILLRTISITLSPHAPSKDLVSTIRGKLTLKMWTAMPVLASTNITALWRSNNSQPPGNPNLFSSPFMICLASSNLQTRRLAWNFQLPPVETFGIS
ncbi:ER degradation-enhancing alpha-mannosidase-like protein 3 [Platysternon megacephalum]|uniref:ER degradation-enhancing alpha-mannosidase-like protein 3 n=1 Tax=Platysternon megacephalum TaxID=55544 RepID=A0A4D9E8X0_9SAUR|nr:ER degradation-enhancing alpha-mannosidase-like protein 3 [Platysternon megacephalum]